MRHLLDGFTLLRRETLRTLDLPLAERFHFAAQLFDERAGLQPREPLEEAVDFLCDDALDLGNFASPA